MGKMNAIEDKIEALEKSRGRKERKNVIWISSMKRNERSKTLMVRNFDILSGNDRRRMTQMFSRFGALDGGIKIGRNGDGINFAIVTFRDVEDARICERYRMTAGSDRICFEMNCASMEEGFRLDMRTMSMCNIIGITTAERRKGRTGREDGRLYEKEDDWKRFRVGTVESGYRVMSP